ncbi:MAG: VTT domain-containing protein [Aestuariivirga sp.]
MGSMLNLGKAGWGWGAIAVLLAAVVLCFALGVPDYLSLNSLAQNHDMLGRFVAQHFILAILTYIATYIVVAVLSIPGAAVLSVVGGYLFGWMVSAPLTILAATIGALITFQIVKSTLGEPLAKRAGPYITRLMQGFRADAFSYLLFLRLVPAFPFFAVNTVAGLARIDFKTFLFATVLGMVPASLVFGFVGGGLGHTLDMAIADHAACVAEKSEAMCPYDVSAISLLTPQLLLALLGLGVLALIPVFFKQWKRHEI